MERRPYPLPLPPTQICVADHPLGPATDQHSTYRNKFMVRRAYPLPLPPTQINVADYPLRPATDQSSTYFDQNTREFMERRAQPLPLPPTHISVVDHPLGPATDRCYGKPLPQQHQLTKQTRALPRTGSSFCSSAYRLLAAISSCYRRPRQMQARTQSNHPQIEVAPNNDCPTRVRGERMRSNGMLRSVVEESSDPPVNLDWQGNEAVSSSEGFPIGSNDGPNILKREYKTQEQDESVLKLANKSQEESGGERENDIERALEQQPRLIDQYEAMEKAQREWEHKLRGNNSNTQESWDMGNHSDVTEERDEGNAQALWSARKATSSGQEDGSEPREGFLSEEMLKAKPGDNNQNGKTIGSSAFHGQESSLFLLNGKQEESQENLHSQPPEQHHGNLCRHDSPDSKPTNSSSTAVYGALPLNDDASNKNSLYGLNSHEQSHEISSVLESLKQAKLSLQQKINKLPLVDSGYNGIAIQTSPLVSKSEGSGMPVGFSGLFRLPTDFSDEATARFNFRDSTFGFSLNAYPGRGISRISDGHLDTNPYPGTMLISTDDPSLASRYMETGSIFDTSDSSDEASARFNFPDSTPGFSPDIFPGRGISGTSGGQFSTIPYSGTMWSSSSDDQSLSTGYMETGSRFDTKGSPFVPFYLSSDKYLDPPIFPISPSYQNATPSPPMSFGEGPSRPHSSSTIGVPPAYHFPYHGDHTK